MLPLLIAKEDDDLSSGVVPQSRYNKIDVQ